MKILVADDHSLFRRGVSLLLSKLYPEVSIFEAKDVEEAFTTLEGGQTFDLILLDLAMPGMEELKGLERLKARLPETPIVILSALTDTKGIIRALHLGARGYVLKASNEQVLKHAISLVLSGEVYIPSSAFLGPEGGELAAIRGGRENRAPDDPLRDLTDRQRDVLTLMMRGMSNKEIAKELELLESTIKAHVKVILKKLGAANRTQAVMIAAQLGWPLGELAAEERN